MESLAAPLSLGAEIRPHHPKSCDQIELVEGWAETTLICRYSVISVTTTRRGRPTHAEAKILDVEVRKAALAAFVEDGYNGATMDAIAKAAGVTKRSLYARYVTKRAMFVDVVGWALSRYEDDGSVKGLDFDDLEGSLYKIGKVSLKRAVDPENVRLAHIALHEVGPIEEFAVPAKSMMWSGRQRVVTELLRHHEKNGTIAVKDIEIAAEHFLAMVEGVVGRLADYGVFRSKRENERHLEQAVELFIRGVSVR